MSEKSTSHVTMRSDAVQELCEAALQGVRVRREAFKNEKIAAEKERAMTPNSVEKFFGLKLKPLSDEAAWKRACDVEFSFTSYKYKSMGEYPEKTANRLLAASRYVREINVSTDDLETLDSWAIWAVKRSPYRDALISE